MQQCDWAIELFTAPIRSFLGGNKEKLCFNVVRHWSVKQIANTFSRSYKSCSMRSCRISVVQNPVGVKSNLTFKYVNIAQHVLMAKTRRLNGVESNNLGCQKFQIKEFQAQTCGLKKKMKLACVLLC